MATVGAGGTNPSSSSKMEAMSRDELLLHAKKQLLLLHRTKAKCDEIGKKNATLEAALAAKDTQLSDTVAVNDELELKLSLAIADTGKQSCKVQDLQEQLDCMKMKDETASSTFLCLREEISSLQFQIEGFKKQVSQLEEDREAAQKLLEEEHSAEVARLNSCQSELVKECAIVKEERAVLEERVRQHADRTRNEEMANECGRLEEKLRQMTVDIEKTTQEKKSLQVALNELVERCGTLDREMEAMKCNELVTATTLKDIEYLKQENEQIKRLSLEADAVKDDEIRRLNNIIDDLKDRVETVRREHAAEMGSLNELYQKESKTLNSQIRSSKDLQAETLKSDTELQKDSPTGEDVDVLRTRLVTMEDGVHRLARITATLFDDDGRGATAECDSCEILNKCVTLCSRLNGDTIRDHVLALNSLSKLETQNCGLQQVVNELQTTLADLQVKVDSLEVSESASVVCRQMPKTSTTDASIQCGDKVVDPVDAATSTEGFETNDDRVQDLFKSLLPKFDGLLKVLAQSDRDGPWSNDVQKWLEGCKESDTVDIVECLPKIGEVLDASSTKLKNYRDAVDAKLKKPEDSKMKVGIADEELLNKYKVVALKAKQESTATSKKLDAARKELQVATQLKSSLEDKVRVVTAQLAEEKQKHRLTASSLEQTSNLVSLEMADYERHASELTENLAAKDALIGTLEKDIEQNLSRIEGLHHQIEVLEKQNGQCEERIDQLKTASIKLRSELLDFQKAESDWTVCESALVARLETASQEVEASKLQVADASANLRELESSKRATADAHRKAIQVLEARVASLMEELEATRNDYSACRAEYEGYKIRVHSVLKQQKTKSVPAIEAGPDSVGSEQWDLLEKSVQGLRAQNQELSARCEALVAENDALQEEHGNLLQRHNRLVANLGEQESSWRQRLEALQSELRSEQQEQVELGRQLRLQQEAHRVANDRQAEVHRQEVEQLRQQLEAQNLRPIRQKVDAVEAGAASVRVWSESQLREDEPPLDTPWSSERQEGEGSEFNESLFPSSQKLRLSSPTSAFIPLERLLNRDERNEGSSSAVSMVDLEKLENELSIASKKIDHMAEILHESETNNARATEQVRLLKDEIRRLERNQEREKHMANMEYLKNVIVKFLVLSSGDERERLVPVLTTLLRLSPDEEQRVFAVAKGNSDAAGIVGSGWSTYLPLPRWPGT